MDLTYIDVTPGSGDAANDVCIHLQLPTVRRYEHYHNDYDDRKVELLSLLLALGTQHNLHSAPEVVDSFVEHRFDVKRTSIYLFI